MNITKEQQGYKCPTGTCPVGIDSVEKIGLTSLEKKAIFFIIKRQIEALRKTLAVQA